MRRLLILLGVLIALGMAAVAQDPAGAPDEDDGFLANLLQNQLSAPGRQIRLQGVTGALSSVARVAEITVSDDLGPWLRLQGVEIDWSRRALLLGRVNVNRLGVERIEYLRPAAPPERGLADQLPQIEAQPFSLPELPVAVRIGALDLPEIVIAEAIFGQAAVLGASGRLDLAGGALDAALVARRLDGPGGELDLAIDFSNATRLLDLDLRLQEPQNGVVAALLGIEDRPEIDLRLQGAGPLDALDVDFTFDAAGARIADGAARLRGVPEGLAFDANLRGALAPVTPADYRAFFAGETVVEVAGVNLASGGLRIDRLAVRGAALALTGALETAQDGFPRALTLSGRIGDPAGPAIALPAPGGPRIHSAILHLAYGDGRRWTGLLALDRLTTGGILFEDLTLEMGGLAEHLDDSARRNVTVALEGVATGVWSEDPATAAALGTRIDFFADAALPPEGPLDLRQAQLSGNGLSIFLEGAVAGLDGFDGRIAARVADIAAVSGLAGRELGGSLDVRATGAVRPLSGAFDLRLEGAAQDLALGDPRLDALLAGVTTLSGGVARDAAGLRTDAFRLANPQLELTSTGRLSSGAADLAIDARLSDLARLDPRLAGALTVAGRIAGEGRPLGVSLVAEAPEARLMERALTGARLAFDGQAGGVALSGTLRGAARLDDQPVTLAADLAVDGDSRALRDLVAQVGPNRLTGEIAQRGAEPVVGALALRAPDLSPLAALALTEASGALDATIRLLPAETGQGVTIDAQARDLVVPGARVGALEIDALVVDAFGAPLVQGDVAARDLAAGGLEITRLAARAEQSDAASMRIDAEAQLAIGAEARASGALTRLPDGFAATLDALTLEQEAVAARLIAPATITVAAGAVTLTPLALDLGDGRLTAEGVLAERVDVDLVIEDLPLALANAVLPALALEGVVNGSARITGPRGAPDATFDLTGAGIASRATREAGLPPVEATATGRTEDQRLQLDAALAAAGLDARVTGSAPLGAGALDIEVTLGAFPLPLIDPLAGGRGIAGTLTGAAQLRGPVGAPEIAFDLRGAGVSDRLLRDSGLAPLAVAATGRLAGNVLTLDEGEATNEQGLAVTASGQAPLRGPGLDVRASGTAPLAAANALLAERGAQASGLLRFDVTATGALAAPQLGGVVTLENGTLVDPETNVRLENVTADAALQGETVTLRALRAEAAAGGVVTAAGTVSTNAAQGYPADLAAQFTALRYTDGAFVSTQFDGELRLLGPLAGGAVLSGLIDLGPTEISVVEGLGRNAQATLAEVIHRLPPPRVQETLRRARVDDPRTRQATGRFALQTNIRIRAPNQIFVRGRGLDVELGGELTVTGPTTDIVPVGQFDLRRGRLNVLGQRIDFDEGSLQLTGNLDPQIFFVARTVSEDITAIVTVSGRVSSPDIAFSSQPPLPQDEVLARVIFNRSVARLSPFQIAQLAAAAAELAGGGDGGPGILEALRGAIGFDDLDIVTEPDGQAALRAGRYIDDNIYLDVQAEQDGDTRAQVNLDVTDNLTVRGSVGTDGNSTLGIFYERDY